MFKILNQFKMLLNIWKYTKGSRSIYFPIAICLALNTLESLLSPYFISQIIDSSIPDKDYKSLFNYIVLIVIIYTIGCFSIIISQKLTVKLERKITLKMRNECLLCISRQSGSFYTNVGSSDLLTLVQQDVECISDVLSRQILSSVHNMIKIIGVLFFIIKVQFTMTVVTLVIIALLVFLQRIANRKIENVTVDSRDSIIRLQGSLQEFLTNLINFISNGLVEFQMKKIKKNDDDFTIAKLKVSLAMVKYHSLMDFISSSIMVTVVGWGGFRVIKGVMTIGDLFSFQIYTQRLISPILNLSNVSSDLASSSVSWSRINQLLLEDNKVNDVGNINDQFSDEIKFENVTFAYNQKNILLDTSLTIKKGTIHAIVGPSGAGKTTLINLIFRLWEVNSGKITIDGKNITDYSLKSLREQIGIISQNVFLLNDTIYNNIVLDKKNVSDQQVLKALTGANILKYVDSLKDGWNTVIGENGIRLSGGEKQRLAIARAIFQDCPIMIFDEATSMLDNNTENEITKQIFSLFKEKTIIMIAHRLSSIKHADIISVLKDGKIIEYGTHQELLNEEDFYYSLYNAR